jgi:NAD(P)-dependent dehydrogenase (short-subunit alcohol dehydrogenase family)
MELKGARCLVTGSSSGIGRAVAQRLAGEGAFVWASARRTETLSELEDEGLDSIQLDVTDDESVRAAVQVAGDIDVLVNNAGFGLYGAVEEIADDELIDQFETNVFGPWRVARAVIPAMRRNQRGVIVNVSSFAGVVPMANGGPYRMSKYALEALSGTLHFELSHFGIRTIDVQLGNVATRFSDAMKRGRNSNEDGPYGPMRSSIERMWPRMCPGALDAGEAARAIVAEISRERGPLRVPIGEDAQRLTAFGRRSDADYENYVVRELGFDWHPCTLIDAAE